MDEDCSGEVEFSEFIKCIEKNKLSSQRKEDETDTVDAFVAMGGNVSTAVQRQRSVVAGGSCCSCAAATCGARTVQRPAARCLPATAAAGLPAGRR